MIRYDIESLLQHCILHIDSFITDEEKKRIRYNTQLPIYPCVSRICSSHWPLSQRQHAVNVVLSYKCNEWHRGSSLNHTDNMFMRREQKHKPSY